MVNCINEVEKVVSEKKERGREGGREGGGGGGCGGGRTAKQFTRRF